MPQYTEALQLRLPANVQAAAFHGGAALGPVLAKTFDATSMLTRSNDQLATCPDSGRLLLRLEDDSPFAGTRELHNVTIFYPCWLWPQANLKGIGAVKLRLGQMPYTFQLAHDEPNRRFEPAQSAHGEVLVRRDGCKGPLLAQTPLPARPAEDGFLELVLPLTAATGTSDLCVIATGDTRPTMWVVDAVSLVPAAK